MIDEMKSLFREGALENLAELEAALLTLAEAPDATEEIDRVFRVMHTLKGSAGMVGFDAVAALAHALENELDVVRTERRPVTAAMIRWLLQARDLLLAMVETPFGSEPVDPGAAAEVIAGVRAAHGGDRAPTRPAFGVTAMPMVERLEQLAARFTGTPDDLGAAREFYREVAALRSLARDHREESLDEFLTDLEELFVNVAAERAPIGADAATVIGEVLAEVRAMIAASGKPGPADELLDPEALLASLQRPLQLRNAVRALLPARIDDSRRRDRGATASPAAGSEPRAGAGDDAPAIPTTRPESPRWLGWIELPPQVDAGPDPVRWLTRQLELLGTVLRVERATEGAAGEGAADGGGGAPPGGADNGAQAAQGCRKLTFSLGTTMTESELSTYLSSIDPAIRCGVSRDPAALAPPIGVTPAGSPAPATASSSPPEVKRLGEILVERGDVDPAAIERVLPPLKPIGARLIEAGVVAPDRIAAALAEQARQREAVNRYRRNEGASSIRVNSLKLDKLVNLIGELVTVQERLSQVTTSLHELKRHELLRIIQKFDLAGISEEVSRLTGGLRDNALSIRMMPIEATFNKFRRLVHDLAAELGKEIELTMSGTDTEIDKTVIDRLDEPLVHLIRNCADHGIEMPEQRERAGKPRRGRIHLAAEHVGGSVVIRVEDDGAGLDRDRIVTRAIERGLVPAGAEVPEREALALIFRPGFSTAATVSNISGRGVGLDVVKQTIEELRGTVEVSSRPGRGTAFELTLPLTLAIIDGLRVRIGSQDFIVPLSAVEECVEHRTLSAARSASDGTRTATHPGATSRLGAPMDGEPGSRPAVSGKGRGDLIRRTDANGASSRSGCGAKRQPPEEMPAASHPSPTSGSGSSAGRPHGDLVEVRGRLVPFIRLRDRFRIPGKPPAIEQIIITSIRGQRLGFAIDAVIGEHKTVIKPLGRIFRELPEFSGATILGDGSIAVILDLGRLARFAGGDPAAKED